MIISTKEQQLKQGQSYTVVFKAKGLAQIQGYQFTLNIDPDLATIEGIDYNGVMKADNIGYFPKNGQITTSYNVNTFVRAPLAGAQTLAGANAPVQGQPLRGDEILFTLKLKAQSNTALSRTLDLTSRLTNIEAYKQSEEVMGIQLKNYGDSNNDFAVLRQNIPNPFSYDKKTLLAYGKGLSVKMRVLLLISNALINHNLISKHKTSAYIRSNDANVPGLSLFQGADKIFKQQLRIFWRNVMFQLFQGHKITPVFRTQYFHISR